ncbi:MAG: TolC family protein [Verrucomicrobiae bacterium]|nr:TolC family protein [Verrucomicrobiae bacterium]
MCSRFVRFFASASDRFRSRRRHPLAAHAISALLAFAGASFLATRSLAGDPPEVLTPAVVAGWTERMYTNHPALAAAAERSRASRLHAEGVRRFADPEVRFGGAIYSPQGMSPAMQGNLVYGVEQKLPFLGKETADRRLADAESKVESARSTALAQSYRRDLSAALFATALAERIAILAREDLQALQVNEAAATVRYGAGEGASVDVLRLQSEVARRTSELASAEQGVQAARALVNRWLGFAPESPLPSFALPEPAPLVPYSARLVRLARLAEPGLSILDRERDAAEAGLVVSRRQRRPDVGVGVEGWQYGGDGGFRQGMFTVSLNLPWFNRDRYRKDIERDTARLQAVNLDVRSRELELDEELYRFTTRIATARRTALAYREEILPRARAAESAAGAAWASGRGSLTDVLATRRARIETVLEEARAIADQWTALSELLLCCGLEELEALWDPALLTETTPEASAMPSTPSPKL